MVEACNARFSAVGTHNENKKQLHLKTKEQSSDSEGTFRFICERQTQRIELEIEHTQNGSLSNCVRIEKPLKMALFA